MAKLYLREGIYYLTYQMTDIDGQVRQVRKSTGCEDYEKATLIAASILGDEYDKISQKTEISKILLSDFIEKFNAYKKQVGAKTQFYSYVLKSFYDYLDDKWLDEIRPTDIENYLNFLEKHKFSSSSIATYANSLKAAFRQALVWGYIPINYFDSYLKYVTTKMIERQPALSDEVIHKLLMADKHPDLQIAIYLALYAGLQRGEIVALKWIDVNFENNRIRVREGGRIGRVIGISKTLKAMLSWQYDQQKKKPVLLNDSQITYQFNKIRKEMNLPDDVNLKALRRTFAINLVKEGYDIKLVSKILGHTNVQVTISQYGYLVKDLNPDEIILKKEYNTYSSSDKAR
jgi:integrase